MRAMNTHANEADDLVARAARRVLRHLERSGDAAERAAAGSLAGARIVPASAVAAWLERQRVSA